MKKDPKKPRKPRAKKPDVGVTMLQTTPKKRHGGHNAIPSAGRKLFLDQYELSCGNISFACRQAGISRLTFYRWMKSPSRINKKFQRMVRDIEPEERRLDVLEGALLDNAMKGDSACIIYGLKTKGRGRGYVEAKDEPKQEELNPSLVSLKMGIEMRAEEKGIDFEEELRNFLNSRYAEKIRPEIKHQLASELVH